jgi:hypothetical protein
MGHIWVPDSKTNWLTDRWSQYNMNQNLNVGDKILNYEVEWVNKVKRNYQRSRVGR